MRERAAIVLHIAERAKQPSVALLALPPRLFYAEHNSEPSMPFSNRRHRQAAFMRKAYGLANSGKHSDCQTIETALLDEYPEAREWLDRSSIRHDLRKMCERAQREKSNA